MQNYPFQHSFLYHSSSTSQLLINIHQCYLLTQIYLYPTPTKLIQNYPNPHFSLYPPNNYSPILIIPTYLNTGTCISHLSMPTPHLPIPPNSSHPVHHLSIITHRHPHTSPSNLIRQLSSQPIPTLSPCPLRPLAAVELSGRTFWMHCHPLALGQGGGKGRSMAKQQITTPLTTEDRERDIGEEEEREGEVW